MDNELEITIREKMATYAKMQMMAWGGLYNAAMSHSICVTKAEMFLIENMALET